MDVKVQKFQVGEFDYLIQWQNFWLLNKGLVWSRYPALQIILRDFFCLIFSL
jgi:hypothetical protein